MRELIIDVIGEIGGHFGANLGTCELAVALHSLLESPRDKILWDVGHQAYPHKVLTGRRDRLDTIRQYKGLALLLGVRVRARHHGRRPRLDLGRLRRRAEGGDAEGIGEDGKVVAVIGDGALTGGVAYEALHHAGGLQTPMVIVERQRDVDLAERGRDLPLLPARPVEPPLLPGPLDDRGAARNSRSGWGGGSSGSAPR